MAQTDVLVLSRLHGARTWVVSQSSVFPDAMGRWDTEINLPSSDSSISEIDVMATALPPPVADEIRGKETVYLLPHYPKEPEKLGRLRLLSQRGEGLIIPGMWPLDDDWPGPDIKDLLSRSNLSLRAIDNAVVAYWNPFDLPGEDWGWKDDSEIVFDVGEGLFDKELTGHLKFIGQEYRSAPKNEGKKDSVRYCVTGYRSDTRDAAGKLILRLRPITYLTAYPIMERLMQGPSEESVRFRESHFHTLKGREFPFVPNTLDIQVTVITGDRQMLFAKRRADTGLDFMRGRWSATIEEQLNGPWEGNIERREDVFHTALQTDNSVFDAFKRALREEVRLTEEEIKDSKLRVFGVGFEYDSLGTSIYSMVELPTPLTAAVIAERLRTTEEFDDFAWCPFDPSSLRRTLQTGEPPAYLEPQGRHGDQPWEWHASSRLRIWLALKHLVGESDLLRWLQS